MIIVSEGGVGRPIDEIVLNHALFAAHGVEVLGAVVNKVDVESHPHLPDVLVRGLAQHGIELLGCIPYSEFLANPSLELIVTHLDGELVSGRAEPGRTIGHVAIGAMQADHAMEHLAERSLLITPGDREDMLTAALEANRRAGHPRLVSGIILSGGYRPSDAVLAALREADLFAYLVGIRHVPHGAGGGRDPGQDARVRHGEDRHDHRPRGRRDRRGSAPRSPLGSGGSAKGGRTWAPAGLPCTRNVIRPWVAAVAVTRRIIRWPRPAALVLSDGDVARSSGRPQATSQARGMLSVSRVRPMPTAMSANAGPVTRWSSARVDGIGDADVVDPGLRLAREDVGHAPAQHLGGALARVVRLLGGA